METYALESLLNKVTGLEACNFIKKGLKHRCFPVNTAKFLRTPILKNIWELLLLNFNAPNGKISKNFFKQFKVGTSITNNRKNLCETSRMELFTEIIDCIELGTIFCRILHIRCFTGL